LVRTARSLRIHVELANYVNSWKRFGFTDDDVAKAGSDTSVDALVVHRGVDHVVARLDAHLQARANHVAVQVLGSDEQVVPTLSGLTAQFSGSTRP
jgi:hypothetical protein